MFKRFLMFIFGGFVLLALIGACAGGDDKSNEPADNAAKVTAAGEPADKPKPTKPADKPKPPKPPPRERVADAVAHLDAGGYVGEMELVDADVNRASTSLTFKTPEGGLEGASPDDLDLAAPTAFRAVYGEAKFPAKETVVVFQGGLVDTSTGNDLPDMNTGIYTLTKAQAGEIDWTDTDTVEFVIDWSYYRDFVHPAITQG